MTTPQFVENLQLLFPELESIPHHDSLQHLLATIDVEQIEQAHIELIRRLIRNEGIATCYFKRTGEKNRKPAAPEPGYEINTKNCDKSLCAAHVVHQIYHATMHEKSSCVTPGCYRGSLHILLR